MRSVPRCPFVLTSFAARHGVPVCHPRHGVAVGQAGRSQRGPEDQGWSTIPDRPTHALCDSRGKPQPLIPGPMYIGRYHSKPSAEGLGLVSKMCGLTFGCVTGPLQGDAGQRSNSGGPTSQGSPCAPSHCLGPEVSSAPILHPTGPVCLVFGCRGREASSAHAPSPQPWDGQRLEPRQGRPLPCPLQAAHVYR